MADKIPVYGELDCRTAENIIADAEQIRYDDTKNVKEKIDDKMSNPSNTGTIGQVLKKTATGSEWADESGGEITDNTVMDNTTLYSLTNIALQKLETYKKLSINVNEHKALYVVNDNALGTSVRPIGSAGRGLLLGTLDSSENFTPLNDQYTYDKSDDSFTYGFHLPCIIQCTKSSRSYCVYTVISAANVADSRVVCHRIKCSADVELPVIVGARYTNNTINNIATTTNIRMKLLTKSNVLPVEVAAATVAGFNANVSQYNIEVNEDNNALTAYIHMIPTNTSSVSGSFALRITNYSDTTIVLNRCYIIATYNNTSGSLPQSNDKPIEFTYTKYTPSEENSYKFLEAKFESNSNWNTADGVDIQVRVYYTASQV